MIKYVAIKGGGVNLIAYITFLQKVWDTGLLANVQEYAGTSAGSIISGLLAAGYTPDELDKILSNFDFKQLEDGDWFDSFSGIFSTKHGIHPGDWLESWADRMFAVKLGKNKATFRDLIAAGRPSFTAVTTDLKCGEAFLCNYQNTPDIILSEALRASMSIPLLFELFNFTQGVDSNKFFSDGGEQLNYPINLFDQYPEQEVLGLYLHDISNVQPPVEIKGFRSFVDAHFESLLSSCDSWLMLNQKWIRQTVFIDTGGHASTDFNINKNPATIAKLKQYGVEAATKYLQNIVNG